jgi:hypothetical protein
MIVYYPKMCSKVLEIRILGLWVQIGNPNSGSGCNVSTGTCYNVFFSPLTTLKTTREERISHVKFSYPENVVYSDQYISVVSPHNPRKVD